MNRIITQGETNFARNALDTATNQSRTAEGSAVVSAAPVGVPPTSRRRSPDTPIGEWNLPCSVPTVRRDAEQSDRDGRGPLSQLFFESAWPRQRPDDGAAALKLRSALSRSRADSFPKRL